MLSLTRKTDYALVALTTLASGGKSEWISGRRLSKSTGVPLPVLMNVLHQLLQHGLVASARGALGGYRLNRSAKEISLADVIRAMEGDISITICCHPSHSNSAEPCEVDRERASVPEVEFSGTAATDLNVCDMVQTCSLRRPLQRINERLADFFGQITLEQIWHDAHPSVVELKAGREVAVMGVPS